jgi:cytochrome c-type biogenesis protein CcmH
VSAWTPRDRFRWRAAATLATVLALAAWPALAAAAHVRPRASLTQIEPQVMCVTCKIPLNVAQSPQADRERAYIQSLIDKGEDEAEIKRALVGQYGANVLGLPKANGFDLTVYVVPIVVVLASLALLLTLVPRWRRQARAQALASGAPRALDPGDAARLDSDLARFDRG